MLIGSGGSPVAGTSSYKVAAALVVLAFLLLAGRLWFLQVARGEQYYRRSADNFVKEIDLPAPRGEVRDRKGRVLIENRPKYSVYVTPRFATEAGLERLARILNASEESIARARARMDAKAGRDRMQQVLAFEDIGRDEMAALETDADMLPGISVVARSHRSYPFHKSAAHVLGYMNEIGPDELAELRARNDPLGYSPGDYVGRAGIEREWESYLRGKDGYERLIVDARGRQKTGLDLREIAQVVEGPMRRDPSPGDNVVLTIDLDLQRATEKALARWPSAAAVVVEVNTGRVLALASQPAFDPNVLTGKLSRAEDDRLQHDPYRPMIDKAIRENYFPGSTFKIVPALAALEDGQLSPDERMKCTSALQMPGHTFHCMEVHGNIDLRASLVESCNIFFCRLGERLGLDRIAKLAMDFGFGTPTGVGLPGEVAGFIPTMDWYKKQGGFRIGYALNTAIGQGSTKVTLMQLALAYAALANRGKLYVPQLVDRIETPSGKVVQSFPPRLRREIPIHPEYIDQVRSALCGVVNEEKGTAWNARDPELTVDVCGKTGTAQVKSQRRGDSIGWDTNNAHGWFASFAPAQDPEYVVVVLAEHGGLGGKVAAPAAIDIYRYLYGRKPGWEERAAKAAAEKNARRRGAPPKPAPRAVVAPAVPAVVAPAVLAPAAPAVPATSGDNAPARVRTSDEP